MFVDIRLGESIYQSLLVLASAVPFLAIVLDQSFDLSAHFPVLLRVTYRLLDPVAGELNGGEQAQGF